MKAVGLCVVWMVLASADQDSGWTNTMCDDHCGRLALCKSQHGACRPIDSRESGQEWTMAFEEDTLLSRIDIPDSVKELTIEANDHRLTFTQDLNHSNLNSIRFSHVKMLDGLPRLPRTVQSVYLDSCVFSSVPVEELLHLSNLSSVDFSNSTSGTTLVSLHHYDQLEELLPRIPSSNSIACPEQSLSKPVSSSLSVCVYEQHLANTLRRLQTSSSDSGSESDDGDYRAYYVLIGMSAPLVYIAYKIFLYVYFWRSYSSSGETERHHQSTSMVSSNRHQNTDLFASSVDYAKQQPPSPVKPNRMSTVEDEETVTNASTGSLSFAGDKRMSMNIDTDLQSFRIDFRRLSFVTNLAGQENSSMQSTDSQKSIGKAIDSGISVSNRSTRATSAGTQKSIRSTQVLSPHSNELWIAEVANTNHIQKVVAKFCPVRPRSFSNQSMQSAQQARFRAETKRLATLSHPHVAQFVGITWSVETNLVVLTEYVASGDLRSWLSYSANFLAGRWSIEKVQLLLDIASVVHYLHSHEPPLVHGNLNSRNVLLTSELRAKFNDFGTGVDASWWEKDLANYRQVGSGRWLSPEALLAPSEGGYPNGAMKESSDIYSLGILMTEMDTHDMPFGDLSTYGNQGVSVPESDLLDLIARGALAPTLSPSCDTRIAELIRSCTQYERERRPRIDEVVMELQEILKDYERDLKDVESRAEQEQQTAFV